MREILRTEIGGMTVSKGDLVLILRNTNDGFDDEQPAFIHSINFRGQVYVNYGNVVGLLNDLDQVRLAPEGQRDILTFELQQTEAEFRVRWQKAAGPLTELLEEYHANRDPLHWLVNSIKGKLKR